MTKKNPRAYRTISEVSGELDLAAHVLRYWEAQFPQLRPRKGPGNRRHYRPEDITILHKIKHLVHEQGMSLKEARAALREGGLPLFNAIEPDSDEGPASESEAPDPDAAELHEQENSSKEATTEGAVQDITVAATEGEIEALQPALESADKASLGRQIDMPDQPSSRCDDEVDSGASASAKDTAADESEHNSEEEAPAVTELAEKKPALQAESRPRASEIGHDNQMAAQNALGVLGFVADRGRLGAASVVALKALQSQVERVLSRRAE